MFASASPDDGKRLQVAAGLGDGRLAHGLALAAGLRAGEHLDFDLLTHARSFPVSPAPPWRRHRVSIRWSPNAEPPAALRHRRGKI